jgi:hypothetical protein
MQNNRGTETAIKSTEIARNGVRSWKSHYSRAVRWCARSPSRRERQSGFHLAEVIPEGRLVEEKSGPTQLTRHAFPTLNDWSSASRLKSRIESAVLKFKRMHFGQGWRS